MGLDDALDDRETEARASGAAAIATPKPLKDELALILRDAWAAIEDLHPAVFLDNDVGGRSLWSMVHGVLDQIAHRVKQRLRIADHPDRLIGSGQGDVL